MGGASPRTARDGQERTDATSRGGARADRGRRFDLDAGKRGFHCFSSRLSCCIAHLATRIPPMMVGIRKMIVLAPERGVMLNVTAWYPARARWNGCNRGRQCGLSRRAGSTRRADADGSYPLICSRTAACARRRSGAWIASRLAAQGLSSRSLARRGSKESTARDAPKELWLRPADLSATLSSGGKRSDPADTARCESDRGSRLPARRHRRLAARRRSDQRTAVAAPAKGGAAMDCTGSRGMESISRRDMLSQSARISTGASAPP